MEVYSVIPFNVPPYLPRCSETVAKAMQNHKICGDGPFTNACSTLLEEMTGAPRVLLTTSCSTALDMAALVIDIQPGDEVIMPSYTFCATANAFALRGAHIVFVDVDPATMNIDPACVKAAITAKTKAIVPMHYAGFCCDMDALSKIANDYHLYMVEDAAQAVDAAYKGKPAGTFGDIGCYSFHETKNFSMGEGGAIILNREDLIERAEIIREKGTNRSSFYRGQVDKYTWRTIGSSFLPSELNAAYLLPQLEERKLITADRMARVEQYHTGLADLEQDGCLRRMTFPENRQGNAHMYYFFARSLEERTALLSYLKQNGVNAVFHYVPLHSAEAGLKYGHFEGEDRYTTDLSERLVRLPLYYGLNEEDCAQVIKVLHDFYQKRN